jgi:hypothetical protein
MAASYENLKVALPVGDGLSNILPIKSMKFAHGSILKNVSAIYYCPVGSNTLIQVWVPKPE